MTQEPTTNDLPLLHVTEDAWDEVSPLAVDVHVTFKGEQLFPDSAALAKVEDLRALVVALGQREVSESAVSLEGVSIEVTSGVSTKSPVATYRARVHLTDTSKLTEVLDVVAGSKKASLTHLTWEYDAVATPANLLGLCAARAAEKARILAKALGVTRGRLQLASESRLDEDATAAAAGPGGGGGASSGGLRSRVPSFSGELAGLELAPRRKIGVRVSLAYVIGDSPRSTSGAG
jgi:Protein of unknown function (DUF541)